MRYFTFTRPITVKDPSSEEFQAEIRAGADLSLSKKSYPLFSSKEQAAAYLFLYDPEHPYAIYEIDLDDIAISKFPMSKKGILEVRGDKGKKEEVEVPFLSYAAMVKRGLNPYVLSASCSHINEAYPNVNLDSNVVAVDPAPVAPQVVVAEVDAPAALEVAEADPVPQADAAPEVPQAYAALEVPHAYAAPEVPQAYAAPEVPQADAAPEVPQADAAPEVPQADAAPVPEVPEAPRARRSRSSYLIGGSLSVALTFGIFTLDLAIAQTVLAVLGLQATLTAKVAFAAVGALGTLSLAYVAAALVYAAYTRLANRRVAAQRPADAPAVVDTLQQQLGETLGQLGDSLGQSALPETREALSVSPRQSPLFDQRRSASPEASPALGSSEEIRVRVKLTA